MRALWRRLLGFLPIFFCMGSSCACSSNGCSIDFSGGSGTNVQSISIVPDPVQANNNSALYSYQCSHEPDAFPLPTTWTITETNGTVLTGQRILWPKGNGSTTSPISYYLDPGIEPGYLSAVQNAVSEWNTVLNANAPGVLLISLQQTSSSNNNQVSISEVLNENQTSEAGGTLFTNIPVGKPLNQTVLQNATIVFDPTEVGQSSNLVYATLVHEIGHSLGLNHSQYSSDVMFPFVPSSCLTSNNAAIPSWDTSYLESVYDPVFVEKGGSGGQCRNGKTCPLVGKALSKYRPGRLSPVDAMRWSTTIGYQGYGDAFGTPIRALRNSTNGIVSVHVDDHDGAARASLTNLMLASSLVARVHILRGTTEVDRYPYRYYIRRAAITKIYRHLLGPDANRRVGDLIDILDIQPMSSGVFLDDPPLDENSDPIVFLGHAKHSSRFLKSGTLFIPNVPTISKIGVDQRGIMYVPGSTLSSLANQVNGRPFRSFPGELMGYTSPDYPSEEVMLKALLRNEGIATDRQITQYSMTLAHNPGLLFRSTLSSH